MQLPADAEKTAVIREANERIEHAAKTFAVEMPVPFLCECADSRCRELIRVPRTEFARVRRGDRRYLVAPGHEDPDLEVIVEAHGWYAVVERAGATTL